MGPKKRRKLFKQNLRIGAFKDLNVMILEQQILDMLYV
jgi:hypothetical protein